MATKRRSQEQKLRDTVAHASSCLKEAGDALHGRGPSQHYADAFNNYGHALKDLVQHKAGSLAHVADWAWDGYNAVSAGSSGSRPSSPAPPTRTTHASWR